MSTALTYIVIGYANFLGSQLPSNTSSTFDPALISVIGQPPVKLQERHYNYTHTPGVGTHRVHTGIATWNTARRICEEQGAHLAIINSVAEADVIVQLLNDSKAYAGYVGVHDLYQEDEFVTIHGESLAETGFDVWSPGEPNNSEGDEDCVMIVVSNGNLNDVSCSTRINFVCEVPHIQPCVMPNLPSQDTTATRDFVHPGVA